MTDTTDTDIHDRTAKLLEQLLANNRTPKVSELRVALTAASLKDNKGYEETLAFACNKISGPSQAMMAFCDAKRLYRKTDLKCETRKRNDEDLMTGGGLVDGVGLYATQDIAKGEKITEFDIHAVSSAYNNDTEQCLYVDPRITSQEHLDEQREQETAEIEALLSKESVSVHFGHTQVYYIPLVLNGCPYKQWVYANDTMPCPDPNQEGYDMEDLVAYQESASRANCMGSCPLGFDAHLVAVRPIKAGEEIIYHWGSAHWKQLRQLGEKGLWQVLAKKPDNEEKEEEDDDEEKEEDMEELVHTDS